MNQNFIPQIANYLYNLFVVNPYAIAIQTKDGGYCTKYIHYDESILEAMLLSHGSAGCYQQGLKNGLIKWICLDFDCKDKENPNLEDLLFFIKQKIVTFLEERNIHYLLEFSGRRGIHVWIIFNQAFEKKIGFCILKKITENLGLNESKFNLDEFPASDSSKNNKVGKQVKFPLSYHRMGGQSFFFYDKLDKTHPQSDDFYLDQLNILKSYQVNTLEDVCEKLGLTLQSDISFLKKSVRYKIASDVNLSVDDIIETLSKISIYDKIFTRLKNGIPLPKDWFVILGTIGCIDKDGDILKSIFAQSVAYDEQTTQKNIFLWKDKYFPATFGYLYKLYNEKIEPELNSDDTAITFLSREFGFPITEIELPYKNEKKIINSIQSTIEKERNYLLTNDENAVISIWNRLKTFSNFDRECIQYEIDKIQQGDEENCTPSDFKIYERYESPEKIRRMVSLGAHDRVLTTQIAVDLAYSCFGGDSESFSYKVAFTSNYDIFDSWFTSWGNYIEKIKSYIETPFMNDWGVITIDLKHFYDSIDFVTVYLLFEKELEKKEKKEMNFLIKFNDYLMRQVNKDKSRKGVPQGPAYARVISEMFLSRILKERKKFKTDPTNYRLYRYVDDIVIFYKKDVNSENLFNELKHLFIDNGLSINEEKSKIYGPIGCMTQDDKDELLRKEKFNYMYQKSDMNLWFSEKEKKELFRKIDSGEFSLDSASYIFSERIDETYTQDYYKKYSKNIFSSKYGRGRVFKKFYDYLFENEALLSAAVLENKNLDTIPINSLNFKNFISSLYLSVQSKKIKKQKIAMITNKYLKNLDMNRIEEEEKDVISALIEWGKA